MSPHFDERHAVRRGSRERESERERQRETERQREGEKEGEGDRERDREIERESTAINNNCLPAKIDLLSNCKDTLRWLCACVPAALC